MTCEESQVCLSADLDGELSSALRKDLLRHLEGCPACRRGRASAEALRDTLARAASAPVDGAARDESVIAALCREGIVRPPRPAHPLHQRLWQAGLRVRSALMPSLRPAIAGMAIAFLLAWGSLRWAETGAESVLSSVAPLQAATQPRPLDAALLDQWLAGSPTLAALARLQLQPATSERRVPARRGAAPHTQDPIG